MGTIDGKGNRHHGKGSPDGGRFAGKSNSAPSASITVQQQKAHEMGLGDLTHAVDAGPTPTLFEDTSYAVSSDEGLIAAAPELSPELIDTATRAASENPDGNVVVRAEAGNNGQTPDSSTFVDGGRNYVDKAFPAPKAGQRLICEHQGDVFDASELTDRGLTLFEVNTRVEDVILLEPETRADLEQVREALTERPGDGPYLVDCELDPDDRPS